MEFDPDFKALLSPDAIAAANATIEGAAIQAEAARYAADKQYEASLITAVITIISALLVLYSAKISSRANDLTHKSKSESAKALLMGKCYDIQHQIAVSLMFGVSRPVKLGSDIVGSVQLAFSFFDFDHKQLSPDQIENFDMLGGKPAYYIDILQRRIKSLDEFKEVSVKQISARVKEAEMLLASGDGKDTSTFQKSINELVEQIADTYTNRLSLMEKELQLLISSLNTKKKRDVLQKLHIRHYLRRQ